MRSYRTSDFAALKAIHDRARVAFDNNILRFGDRLIAESDGRVVAALLGRPSEQVDLLLDRDFGSPNDRWNLIVHLFSCGEIFLREQGIRHTHCFVPHEIVKSYGKRLESLGFNREAGATFLKDVW